MKQKKSRSFWAMLAAMVCMCMTMVFGAGTSVKAENEGQTYTYTAETAFVCGTDGVITAYTGNKNVKEIIVPKSIGGVTVTGIGAGVFKDVKTVETIAIPDTVLSFGNEAFRGCEKLRTLYSYQPADSLNADGTVNETGVVIPYSENGIISIPSNLRILGTAAFAGCTSIGRFAVPEANPYFTTYAWDRATQETNNTNTSTDVTENTKNQGELLMSKNGTILYRLAPAFHYTGENLYAIPSTVVTISPYACERVGLNGGFTIPTSVQVIGDYAFYQCGNLNQIAFAEVSKTSVIGAYAFAYNSNLNITLPASVMSIGAWSFSYCSNIQIDISKTKLQVIPDYAFYECDNLHYLETPKTLQKVGAYVFYGCNNLSEVKFLGKTLQEIGTGAFQTCNNLHVVEIPEGVTDIANGTFDGCQNLNTVILPDSLKNIGDNAFKDCQNIHQMVIPKNVTHISKNSFAGANQNNIDTSKNQYSQKFIKAELPKTGVKFTVNNYKYKITKSHKTKGTVTLYGVKKKTLTSATIPSTIMYKGYKFKVTAIGSNAFKSCKKLKTVKVGANVTSIGSKAFYGCTKLKKVTFGKNVKKIGTSAFYGCKKLTTVTLDKKLTTIGKTAFAKCTALKKITIPSKVTKIGSKAFYGCTRLKSVVIKTSKLSSKKVGKSAFTKIYKKASIKVPAKKYKAYKTILKKSGIGKSVKIKK